VIETPRQDTFFNAAVVEIVAHLICDRGVGAVERPPFLQVAYAKIADT